jgi:hypothetical protein
MSFERPIVRMKIRTDFVTNSSSTSFIIITDGDLDKRDFFDLVGVIEESSLSPIFGALFDRLLEKMVSGSEYSNWRYAGSEGLKTLVKDKFSQEVAQRVVEAQRKGKKVYVGDLSSESDEIESFFCCDSFELENEKIYFNALECSW